MYAKKSPSSRKQHHNKFMYEGKQTEAELR